MSPIQLAAATFALALAQTDQAGSAAENAFRPSGILSFPDKLSGTGKYDFLTKFRTKLIGALKANDTTVLDGVATWSSISFISNDPEFLESSKLSTLDICRIFAAPPSVAGVADSANYSNSVEESRALVARCLTPMAKRIEQAMLMSLLSPEARKPLYIEQAAPAWNRCPLSLGPVLAGRPIAPVRPRDADHFARAVELDDVTALGASAS